MNFLDSSGDGFLGVFKVEAWVPLNRRPDFNSPVLSVLLLKFQDYLDRITIHLLFGQHYLRNLPYFLIGIELPLSSLSVLQFLTGRPRIFNLLRRGINDYDWLLGFRVKVGLFSIPKHPFPILFIIWKAIIFLVCIISRLTENRLFVGSAGEGLLISSEKWCSHFVYNGKHRSSHMLRALNKALKTILQPVSG